MNEQPQPNDCPLAVVLLAEDNPILRNLYLYILQSLSYAVLVAADGREAMELSHAFHGDILLLMTDMDMPRCGGDELGELLLKDRPGVRILQVSGSTVESFIGRNLTIGFLQKPFAPGVLASKISEVMAAPPGTLKKLAADEL
jgi:two-component system cell cycle sensor histidine kinase/response regulator CckA